MDPQLDRQLRREVKGNVASRMSDIVNAYHQEPRRPSTERAGRGMGAYGSA